MNLLDDIYAKYRACNFSDVDFANNLSAPLIIKKPYNWDNSKHRIIYIGQETFGWRWGAQEAQRRGHNWSYSEQNNLRDFFSQADSLEAMVAAYGQFDFAANDPDSRRSPFWRYFRDIRDAASSDGSETSIVWSNVVRCNVIRPYNAKVGDLKIWNLDAQRRRLFLNWQSGLLTSEINALQPSIIFFMCGPNYDHYLRDEFGDLKMEPLAGFSLRQAARLSSKAFSAPAYRTYHPGYLNRSLGFAPIRTALNECLGRDVVGSSNNG